MTENLPPFLGIGAAAAKRSSEQPRTHPRRRFAQSAPAVHASRAADVPAQQAQDTQPSCVFPDKLDRFDRDLLQFALNWAPYGGPPTDELFSEFGIPSRQLVPRIRAIAAQYLYTPMSQSDRGLLLHAIHHFIHLAPPKVPPRSRDHP
ncbi:hypothetical protein [Mycolicibacterium sp. CR10]|uniref:hypothetical protein n=1 Tax=Mycolicibacterium sp. CR10 TaxID=2562314 RepID=UPI0010C117A0|nr:hypothetical protein [Mycolicibacterium sp. CR10]